MGTQVVAAASGFLWLLSNEVLPESCLLKTNPVFAAQQSAPVTAPMTDGRYEQLDVLLTQTNLYSKFLSEQMENLAQVRANGPLALNSHHGAYAQPGP
eukprot:872226-Prorocentrum_minimum.AAC.3